MELNPGHQCGPGSIPAWCHMWVEFVVGSSPCSVGFPQGSPSKFQFDQDRGPA